MDYLRRLLVIVLVGHTPLILADDDYRWISSEQSKVANWAVVQPSRTWTIDYRVRSMFDSQTSYQFGTPEAEPGAYAPLSKLDWPLNSTWHGLQVGLERPNWNVHFEWLTPMTQHVSVGLQADYLEICTTGTHRFLMSGTKTRRYESATAVCRRGI